MLLTNGCSGTEELPKGCSFTGESLRKSYDLAVLGPAQIYSNQFKGLVRFGYEAYVITVGGLNKMAIESGYNYDLLRLVHCLSFYY